MPSSAPPESPRTRVPAHRSYAERLTGGHPNSLGDTVAVVDDVLTHPARLEELYACYFADDPVVRLRTSNAIKRIAAADQDLLVPYLERFLNEVSSLEQASAQWTLAQLMLTYTEDLTPAQRQRATTILQCNLTESTDWIVLIQTATTLTEWAKNDEELKHWLLPHLQELEVDSRKAVAGKATKLLSLLDHTE